ncbi:transcriptional regulator, GntR family [Bacillus glycinifermentans]|nr:transcriptional regulator, GntR family [Bacillus glycinifermentans]
MLWIITRGDRAKFIVEQQYAHRKNLLTEHCSVAGFFLCFAAR